MVITDALEMKHSAPIDEDIRKFIEMYDLDDGAYSIVANIDTQMHVAPYDPHDFDMKEFIKWNVEDYFSFDGDSFQMDACRREYPRHNYHMFMVAVERHSLGTFKTRYTRHLCSSRCNRFWPIPICLQLDAA